MEDEVSLLCAEGGQHITKLVQTHCYCITIFYNGIERDGIGDDGGGIGKSRRHFEGFRE